MLAVFSFPSHLALEVRVKRVARCWRQSDLAAKAGVRQDEVSHLERGTRGLPREQVEAIANALGIELREPVAR